MHFDELINQCIICLKTYNPSIEGPDSFVSKYLKKITKDSNERMFIKQVFYGVLRYKDFLKIFCENLFNSNPSSTERKDEYLYSIFAYLTIFRLDELPLDDYKQFVLFQDAVKMNEFLTFIFDEDVLKNKLREPWIKIYDFNYIDETIINGLLKTKNNIQDLIEFILNKAKIGNVSSTKEGSIQNKENEENINEEIESEKIIENKEDKKSKTFYNKNRKPLIPQPFNLSESKPRKFQEPIQMNNKYVTKPIPLKNYKKTSLNDLNLKHQKQLEEIKKETLIKYGKYKPFEFESEKRPKNFEKIKEEVEKKEKSELQFNNKYQNPIKDFSKFPADVKYNEAAIIREEYLIEKKKKEEENELNKRLIEKKDAKEFNRWVAENKIKDEIENMEKVQKRKIELELNREIASNYFNNKVKKNKIIYALQKNEEKLNNKKILEEKKKEIEEKKLIVDETKKDKYKIIEVKNKVLKQNKDKYKNQKKEYYELNAYNKMEKEIELKRRDDIIRQIRELEKLPLKRTTGFDPTETQGIGLLEEMSLVELKERLEIQKKMRLDFINSKKEENKLKQEERTENLMNKAKIISENRDKLRNLKEIERKKKKDEIIEKNEMLKKIREKSLFELENKILEKKNQLRKEDEMFQKKIREIALQRQFLQLGHAAVEEKKFKQIEDGLERKINNQQNQNLIDQELKETVNYNDIKLRYLSAKKEMKKEKDLLYNYLNDFNNAKDLNDLVFDEDKIYKKAVHDKERYLYKKGLDKRIEKNKFSNKFQQKNFNKTDINFAKNNILINQNNENQNINNEDNKTNIITNQQSDNEEENPIKSKLNKEANLIPS